METYLAKSSQTNNAHTLIIEKFHFLVYTLWLQIKKKKDLQLSFKYVCFSIQMSGLHVYSEGNIMLEYEGKSYKNIH